MPDAPAKHADSPARKSPPAAPSGASSSLVRHFRHGGLNFSSPGMLCPSHTPGSPNLSDIPGASGCAFCACTAPPPPSAVPGMQPAPSAMFRLRSAHRSKSFPQPRLRRIRHRSPQNFLPSRAVSPDLRADSETFCRRGPACAPVPRPKALTPSSRSGHLCAERTPPPREQKSMKKRGEKPPERETLPRAMRQKAKMPSAR